MHIAEAIRNMADHAKSRLDGPGNLNSFMLSIKPSLDDVHFQKMKQALTKTGKGAPPKVDRGPLTHRLALQLELLRVETKKTWKDMESFFPRTVHGDPLEGLSLRTELEATVKEAAKVQQCEGEGAGFTFSDFLCVDLGRSIMCRNVGVHLLKHGVTRSHLLAPERLRDLQKPAELVNGMVVDIVAFMNKDKQFTIPKMRQVLEYLGGEVSHFSDEQLSSKARTIYGKYQSLNKSAKRDGVEKLNVFLSGQAFVQQAAPVFAPSLSVNTWHSAENIKLATSEKSQAMLRRGLEEAEKQILAEKQTNSILREEIRETHTEVQNLQTQMTQLMKDLEEARRRQAQLKREQQATKLALQNEKQNVRAIKGTNFYKKLQRQKRELNKRAAAVADHEYGRCAASARTLRRKIKILQTTVSNSKIELQSLRPLKQQVRGLQAQNDELTQRLAEQNVIRLKDPETGYFTDAAKVCIMELVGEHEIAAGRCGRVIETICRTVFQSRVPEDDLPSERSAIRFVDMSQVLGKLQVASALQNSEHFDLHTDATSKVGKQFVGQQVTTDDGKTLSCGYTVVANENAECLVGLATDLLEEVAAIHEDDEGKQHELFIEFLQKLTGMMSDRAAVMKCFNSHFNSLRKDFLQTNEDLDFLYCNAHVLLGFANAVAKLFKQMGNCEAAGRESIEKFTGNSRGEHPVTRYIREACSCLGPRGDERFGCHQSWLAYCLLVRRPSGITSFKANRFNNLFEASAALHYHQDDISSFLQTCLKDLNWKQEGLLLDSQSGIIDNHLVALGLVFFRLTGPYWRLLGTELHLLDFYKHVGDMKEFLERWEAHPDDAFAEDFPHLFAIDMDWQNNDVFQSLINIPDDRKQAVCGILKGLSSGFLTVIQSQLSDFLPDGKYYDIQDVQLRQRMQHSKLTNLVGEQAFGDLDFSMFKRRNATAHYHSSMNIMKRNKTMTDWFISLSPEEQKAALVRAAAKHQQLRKEKRQAERRALEQRRKLLLENRRKKAALEEKKRQKKILILQRMRPHSGPCTSSHDVRHLLQTYRNNSEKLLALRAELQYHKLILHQKSPLLRVTLKLPQLIINLKQFLGGESGSSSDPDVDAEEEDAGPSPKKRRRTHHGWVPGCSNDDSFSSSNSEEDEVPAEELDLMEEEDADPALLANTLDWDFTFKDIKPGTFVAVAYEDGFYVGEVEEKFTPDTVVVNFMIMCSCPGKNTVFKWQSPPEKLHVHEKFVLAAHFDMQSTNGRFWNMSREDYQKISKKFQAFESLFFN